MCHDPAPATNAIELKNISVTRGGHRIVTDVTMTVQVGTCCAILGPNGSGKSSLLAVISGYLWPSGGTVTVGGHVYGRVSLGEVRRGIGLIEPSRAPRFSDRMRVRDVVATGFFGTIMLPPGYTVSVAQRQRVEKELASLDLHAFGSCPYGQLSTGEQMKTLLARALVADARILLLDEPTVGLDMGARAACVSVLDTLLERRNPPTVVIVSHHLDELPRTVQSVVLMKNGRVLGQGPPEERLTSEELSSLFGWRIEVFRRDGRFVATTHPRE